MYINKNSLKLNLGYWGQERYLGTRGAQYRISLDTLKCDEHLCEEERKRGFFTCIQTTFLYFGKGSFKDTLQGQICEFF